MVKGETVSSADTIDKVNPHLPDWVSEADASLVLSIAEYFHLDLNDPVIRSSYTEASQRFTPDIIPESRPWVRTSFMENIIRRTILDSMHNKQKANTQSNDQSDHTETTVSLTHRIGQLFHEVTIILPKPPKIP